jgi:[citrate (pro-3S)-lyase] ligase
VENIVEIIKENGEKDNTIGNNIKGLSIQFIGKGNRISIYENTDFQNVIIKCGNNNTISIGKTKRHIKNLKIAAEKVNDTVIKIGDGFSCVGCQINMNESASVYIGDDCMFSFEIIIFTSDSHAIYDNTTLECINYGQDVVIGNHVWIGCRVILLKGSVISDNSVIGAQSLVTGKIMENNIIACGVPAKIIKRNINWSRAYPDCYIRPKTSIADNKKHYMLDMPYTISIENNILNIQMGAKYDKDFLFEYHIFDEATLVAKIEYSQNSFASFTLKKFGNYAIMVCTKEINSVKENSFLTEYINYDEISALKYLNYQKSNYSEAISQISALIKQKENHTNNINYIKEKLHAISSFNYNIIEYFKELGIREISIFGHQDDAELSKLIWVSARHSQNFNIKYLLGRYSYTYHIYVPASVNITHLKLADNFSFNQDDVILICTSKKNTSFMLSIQEKTKAKVIHLLDVISDIYCKKFIIEPLIDIKKSNPEVQLICCLLPLAKEVTHKSENELELVTYQKTRDMINAEKPIIPAALDRFNNSLEYNREVVRPILITTINEITYCKNRLGKNVNVINNFRLTTDQPDKFMHNIYSFGNSVMLGAGSSDYDTIPSNLQRTINRHFSSNDKYCVMNCANYGGRNHDCQINLIKNTKFKKGDLIIFSIHEKSIKNLIDKDFIICETQQAFERPHDMGEVFIDDLHLNKIGNQKIAELLFQTMLDNHLFDDKTKAVLKVGGGGVKSPSKPAKSNIVRKEEHENLTKYKSLLLKYKVKTKGKIGSIVMNCNPFTLGHRYLIEQSVQKVKHLYLFVVEEDKSFFPFVDRFELVKQGVKDLQNITVIPSGRFIISSLTFEAYSNKERLQDETIDASSDVTIFAEEIAPSLNINIRFAGEEPLDNITRQYNNTMKMILPQYGIDFEVIKRVESNNDPISASRVRRLLKEKNFDEIREIVPNSTYEYLINRFGDEVVQ